jgi:uroporphyrinogen III methyltransferase/synthase
MAAADVVVYDRLANPSLLNHARRGAELLYAGKLPDRHTLSQNEINTLLIEKAREGKRVVRLKGGDPFVFGRGGEEAEALGAAGVQFEVLPGVTSAIAVPAYAGIPVTHRGIASSFTVITGHGQAQPSASSERAEDDEASELDWPGITNGADTLVFLMGVGSLHDIADRLVEHGRPPETPVAVIEWGTLARQRTVASTLRTIAEDVQAAGLQAPAVTVVGEVARLRDQLRWFDNRPLTGKRVLVTRTREQASELTRLLAAQGAEAIELPTIEIVETSQPSQVEMAVEALRTSAYQWVIFTSPNAISIFTRHLREDGLDARAFGRAQLATIGPGTAAALSRVGLIPNLVPETYIAEGLLSAFESRVMRGSRILLPRAEGARDTLVEGLQSRGAHVDELRLYRAAIPHDQSVEALRALREGAVDIITFASSSAVRNLVEMLEGDVAPLRKTRVAAIGPVTADAVRAVGLDIAVVAREYTIPGLVDAILESLA